MRSLEEWTKYLEQQEQALEQALNKQMDEEPTEEESIEHVRREIQPVARIESSITTSIESPPAPEPRTTVQQPVTATVPDPVESIQTPQVQEQIKAPPPSQDTIKPEKTIPEVSEERVQKVRRLGRKIPKKLTGGQVQEEVAQSSYKEFKETREELLQRLLDPLLSLEDVARILNVCPTTVRRYTNKGVLKHQRTAGNQRRFRLSDVLTFLESQS